uniref:3'-5' exonuclease domain-containing protein n=1 Tax=Gongylonema pulchrum TaxID=637853 RepID=A0A183DBE0_9BILA
LFQICVQDCSYLVDVVTLENQLTEEQWLKFFKALLCDSNATKLGFDLVNDMRVVRATFPFLQPLPEMKNLICILKLVNSKQAFDDLLAFASNWDIGNSFYFEM